MHACICSACDVCDVRDVCDVKCVCARACVYVCLCRHAYAHAGMRVRAGMRAHAWVLVCACTGSKGPGALTAEGHLRWRRQITNRLAVASRYHEHFVFVVALHCVRTCVHAVHGACMRCATRGAWYTVHSACWHFLRTRSLCCHRSFGLRHFDVPVLQCCVPRRAERSRAEQSRAVPCRTVSCRAVPCCAVLCRACSR